MNIQLRDQVLVTLDVLCHKDKKASNFALSVTRKKKEKRKVKIYLKLSCGNTVSTKPPCAIYKIRPFGQIQPFCTVCRVLLFSTNYQSLENIVLECTETTPLQIIILFPV